MELKLAMPDPSLLLRALDSMTNGIAKEGSQGPLQAKSLEKQPGGGCHTNARRHHPADGVHPSGGGSDGGLEGGREGGEGQKHEADRAVWAAQGGREEALRVLCRRTRMPDGPELQQ